MTRYDLAILAAQEAGNALLTISPTDEVINKEGHLNFVTRGDKKSEAILLSYIQKNFPTDDILSEETESSLSEENILASPHLWILDPIDGTSNFRYERKYSCVSVGYAEAGILQFGVAWDPFRGELFLGQKGKGATRNGKPISVSPTTDIAQATMVTGNSYDPATFRKHLELMLKLPQTPWLLIKGSAVLEICEIAAGQADLYYSSCLKPWDNAAAHLILQEAGGVMKNLKGEPVNFLSEEVLAGNERLVDLFIQAIQPLHP